MQMVVHIHHVVRVQFRIDHAKGGNLPFVVDGEGSRKYDARRKLGNEIIQVRDGTTWRPEKGPGSQRTAGLANHLS